MPMPWVSMSTATASVARTCSTGLSGLYNALPGTCRHSAASSYAAGSIDGGPAAMKVSVLRGTNLRKAWPALRATFSRHRVVI
jgi:hypothetical protein